MFLRCKCKSDECLEDIYFSGVFIITCYSILQFFGCEELKFILVFYGYF